MTIKRPRNRDYIYEAYEDCEGIDAKSTALTADPQTYRSLQNMRFAQGRSLTGRRGFQMVGQPGLAKHTFEYNFLRIQDGSTGSELLGMNQSLWRMVTRSVTITRTAGATSWGFQVRYDPITSGMQFQILESGAVVHTRNLGTGFEDNYEDIIDLIDWINGLANYSCTYPPFYLVSSVSDQVLSPSLGVVNVLIATGVPQEGQYYATYNSANNRWYGLLCYFGTAGANFIFPRGTLTIKGSSHLGQGTAPAASIAIAPSNQTTTTTHALEWEEWECVPCALDQAMPQASGTANYYNFDLFPFHSWNAQQETQDIEALPATTLNANQNAYILAPSTVADGTTVTNAAGTSYTSDKGFQYPHEGQLWRYDGRYLARAGVPQPSTNLLLTSGASGADLGTVKYKCVNRYRDYRGVIVEGVASEEFAVTRKTSYSGGVSLQVFPNFTLDQGWYGLVCTASFGGANKLVTDPIPLADDIIPLQVGDTIFYSLTPTSVSTEETIHTKGVVTSVTGSTITIDSEETGYVRSGTYISRGGHVDVYRTTLNGNEYYKIATSPIRLTGTVSAAILVDMELGIGLTDDSLVGVRYNEPPLTFEPLPPPRGRTMANHDGAIVIAGDPEFPNSVFWSRPGADPASNNESFPPLNTAVIPSSVSGPITALISDTAGDLIVGKEQGHYLLTGNIHNRNVGVTIVREGDYGFGSQAATTRIDDLIISVNKLGVYALSGDAPVRALTDFVRPLIEGRNNLDFRYARSHNDKENGLLYMFIPVISTSDSTRNVGSSGVALVLDYLNGFKWFDDLYTTGTEPTTGFTNFNNTLYFGSLEAFQLVPPAGLSIYQGCVFRQLNIPAGDDYHLNFIDHLYSIPYVMQTHHLNFGEPTFDKNFTDFKLWSLLLPSETGASTSADYAINTYRDYQSTTPHTTAAVTIDPSAEFDENIIPLAEASARSLQIKIEVNARNQAPFITGWEIRVVETEQHNDFQK